jgi:hypothetical protein
VRGLTSCCASVSESVCTSAFLLQGDTDYQSTVISGAARSRDSIMTLAKLCGLGNTRAVLTKLVNIGTTTLK